MSDLLNVEQAAAYLNVGVRYIRRLVWEKRVTVVRVGRHIRIKQSDLDSFIEAGTEPARS